MSKGEVDVIDDPDMLLDDVDAQFDHEPAELSGSLTAMSDMSEGEVEEARAAIAASKDSADRLIAASRELESLVFGVVQDESNSLAGTEVDIADAKSFLNRHKLKAARKSVKKAEQSLALLEEDVLHLRRNIAMLHRLLNEKKINEEEVETILLRLHSATGAAEIGDVGVPRSCAQITALNPFFEWRVAFNGCHSCHQEFMINPCRNDNIVRYAGVPYAHWKWLAHFASGGQ